MNPGFRTGYLAVIGRPNVGKSTLTNAIVPEAQAATREISDALDSGKHTTTFARLYYLPVTADEARGGWLIDSPGLQVFGLAHLAAEDLAETFVELVETRGRFGRYRLTPTTGKTHQLRVHMAAMGLPDMRDAPIMPAPKSVWPSGCCVDVVCRPVEVPPMDPSPCSNGEAVM